MLRVDVLLPVGYTEEQLREAVSEKLGVAVEGDIKHLRRAIVTGGGIRHKVSALVELDKYLEARLCKKVFGVFPAPNLQFHAPKAPETLRPVIVGGGPAGLFAALILAEAGARPILIERGDPVEKRVAAVEKFFSGGSLDPESNVQFGEGGAGTFSDGKLKCGGLDAVKYKILCGLVEAGAPRDILWETAAHIGTDELRKTVVGLRNKIHSLGGEIRFRHKLIDFIFHRGKLSGVVCQTPAGVTELLADKVILATGHSARDVFSLLARRAVPMEARGFGIGVRIEHPRDYIDRIRYGQTPPAALGAASYHLVEHLPNGRSVYSFCMCPGGSVVAAATEAHGIVTNGMSLRGRDLPNSNAALLVSVTPEDFGGTPMGGLALQQQIEEKAYKIAGRHAAPSQKLCDFMDNIATTSFGSVLPSYPLGTTPCRLDDCLPTFITDSLRAALPLFDAYLPGFYLPDAVLTGPETRTTSPIRILRGPDHRVPGFPGLFPAGEGAGYAGGIISSAADGIRTALAVLGADQI